MEPFTVTIECEAGNEYDGRLGLRISAIFVIFTGSFLGCLVPLLLARFFNGPWAQSAFFAAKFFGSGVIISTAFIHLLAPAVAALYSPCLDPDSPITTYARPEGICLMSVFAMFLAELVVHHYMTRVSTQDQTKEGESFGLQMTTIFILEFGILFHSVLIGLTLAVAGEEFVVLYIVLTFHQSFEGFGLGSRLALISWPKGQAWLPYILSAAYSLSTPVAIAIGLGVRESFQPGSNTALVVSGVFDAVSAGILLYTGLVELIALDFFSPARAMGIGQKLGAFGWMCLGAGLMALLGNWA